MTNLIGLKFVLVVAGGITSIVGVCINNWKVAAIGNTVAISSLLIA